MNKHEAIRDYILYDEQRPISSIDYSIECNPSLKVVSEYNKGKKLLTKYYGRNNNEIVACKTFLENELGGELKIIFEWFDTEGKIMEEHTKVKIVDLTPSEWFSRKRRQRVRAFDDLKSRAVKYNAGHYIDILFNFFKEELDDYYETASDLFKERIIEVLEVDLTTLTPTQQQIQGGVKQILNASLDGVNKVYETMVYQMS